MTMTQRLASPSTAGLPSQGWKCSSSICVHVVQYIQSVNPLILRVASTVLLSSLGREEEPHVPALGALWPPPTHPGQRSLGPCRAQPTLTRR